MLSHGGRDKAAAWQTVLNSMCSELVHVHASSWGAADAPVPRGPASIEAGPTIIALAPHTLAVARLMWG